MPRYRLKTYRVFAKIYKKNMVDVIFSDAIIFPPKGYIQADHGYVTEEMFFAKKKLYENFKEDYLGYPVYYFRYKRGIKVKSQKMIDEEKRDIENLFVDASEE